MSPQRLTPRFLEKVWGATRLEPWFPNSRQKIGEVWFEGVEDPPLLVKFLFTTEKLSVQVHPDDTFAREHEGSRGKTEMWHVLAAEPGAKIAAGFRESLSGEQLRAAALSGEIENLLEWFDAAPGDTFFIPAGTVHAIGGGLVLCEIQEYSDVTYRLYDYGRPRELHLDRALAVSHRGPHPARQRVSGDVLVSCDYFVTERLRVDQPTRYEPVRGRFQMLIAIEGSGLICGQPTKAGDAWYVPPNAEGFDLTGQIVYLRTAAPSLSRL
jgi:mannose-6-phosphate isomerase